MAQYKLLRVENKNFEAVVWPILTNAAKTIPGIIKTRLVLESTELKTLRKTVRGHRRWRWRNSFECPCSVSLTKNKEKEGLY